MKTSKPADKTSVQEECGVWLDTSRLKVKAKQKRVTRPISKLLNPLLGGEGYNLAVALNFTQTKIEMPKAKQSSISTFFAPQRRVLNKMSEVAIVDPVLPSTTCTSIAPKPVTPGTKRAREMGLDSQNSVPGVDHEWENLPEAAAWHKQSSSHPPSQKFEEQFEELNPPQSKRRLIATSSLSCDSQLSLKAWSQDPLFTYSQYSECDLKNQQNTTAKDFHDFEPPLFNSPQNGEVFGLHLDVEATTSTRKSFKGIISSLMDDEKENRFLSPKSPSKHSTHSDIEPRSTLSGPHQKTVSPRKNFPVHLQKMADKGHSCDSQFIWTKPRHSPIKQQQLSLRAVDEDSLATLFTQDSEGFRVIAHRGVHERSPLKDQTSNVSTWMVRAAAYKSVVEENVEDEMLFTQDSQGNLVIKH